jgi:hypothetical protein
LYTNKNEKNEFLLLQHTGTLGHDQKTKLKLHRVEGAKVQTKAIGNLFNEMIAEIIQV